ncbi:MAG: glycosyltransferase family 39 protein [Kiritimatiellae bacterium]|nr:glycosyltransferase family 39 protein [Kiritimatiellia bacterium]
MVHLFEAALDSTAHLRRLVKNMSDFNPLQQALLCAACAFILASLFFFVNGKTRWSLVWLTAGGLSLSLFASGLDPFLNSWDERFHALVARHMMDAPFRPMLICNPVLPYDYRDWTADHIWVHKPPLFLWQIALAFKLLGVSEFSLRLPSVLMTAGLIPVIYRLGRIAVSARVGYCSAFLYTTSAYPLLLLTGYINLDHNDTAFVFYVTASLWAHAEYERSGRRFWLLPIGLFAGCAVLVKWLTGLLVFGGWGLALLGDSRRRRQFRPYLDIGISLAIALAVFLPWQWYISATYPLESAYTRLLYWRHVVEVMDGHMGGYGYHFSMLARQYGPWAPWLIGPALIILLFRMSSRRLKITWSACVLAIYAFFSFIVKTKMCSFCFTVCSIIYVAFGAGLGLVIDRLTLARFPRTARLVIVGLLAGLGWSTLDLASFARDHAGVKGNRYRLAKLHNTALYKTLPSLLPSNDFIIFNCGECFHVELMFYTDFTAYPRVPSRPEYDLLKSRHIPMAVFDDGKLPGYLMDDAAVFKIKPCLMDVW